MTIDRWVEKPASTDYIEELLYFQRKRYNLLGSLTEMPKNSIHLSTQFLDEPNLHYAATVMPLDKEWVIISLFYLASDKEYHPYMVFYYRDTEATYPIWVVDHVESIDGDVYTYNEMPLKYLERLDLLWSIAKEQIPGIWE